MLLQVISDYQDGVCHCHDCAILLALTGESSELGGEMRIFGACGYLILGLVQQGLELPKIQWIEA